MDKEKINLVLTDICGRLPYGVITKNCKNKFDIPANLLPDVIGIKMLIAEYDLKPYLRPMSSMTEEERVEYLSECDKDTDVSALDGRYHGNDWLKAHHFDYRGLIEEGLALEAPEDMYKVN